MKQTKCLYDERVAPEGMISVSQLQTFLSCRKKWEYDYIENLRPRIERIYLTIGRLCHKGMQTAMMSMWQGDRWEIAQKRGIVAINDQWREYMESTPLLGEEIPYMDNMHDDAISVFCQAFEEFEPWKYEVITVYKGKEEIPALELHFKVPCPPTKGLHGYIDAILRDRETGFTWCVDYKFRKSLSPDEDEAFNIQNTVYAYACKKMGINITGTMTWQHVNTPAANPAILKDGKISRAKIKTTWKKYEQFCINHGQNPQDYYLEMEEKLRDIEWCRVTLEYRNAETVDRIWKECVIPVARQIKSAHGKNASNFRSLYPWNCKMCQYQSICQAELRDYDSVAIRNREYTMHSHNRNEDTSLAHGNGLSLASDDPDGC